MNINNITAWLSLCVRFVFASIIKSVDFDTPPTVDALFQFIDVDPKNKVADLKRYFTHSEPFISTYRVYELIVNDDERKFRELASKYPSVVLYQLSGNVPIVPCLTLLKFLKILFSEITATPEYYSVKETISNIFTENRTSITRAFDASNYKLFVDFADYDIALEIIKSALPLEDFETIKTVLSLEDTEIDWDDILEFNNGKLLEFYEPSTPPTDLPNTVQWPLVEKLIERYPTMYIESFHETWIDPEIAQSQLDFFIHQEGDLDFTGFENFIVNNINSTELVTPLIMSLKLYISELLNILCLGNLCDVATKGIPPSTEDVIGYFIQRSYFFMEVVHPC